MPKVNKYTAGKLASERVGVPSLDQSGAIIGDAVARVASKAVSLIDQSLAKQRALLDRAELTKQKSQFDSDMAVAATEIKSEYIAEPDEGAKQLAIKRKELFNLHKEAIKDPEVKIQFDGLGSESLFKGQALDQIWAFQENNKIIQKTHFDRITQDVTFAGQTDNLDEVVEKGFLLDKDREAFYQAWGGVLEGSQVIDAGQESMVKAYFYGQLSKGNAFKVLKEIEDGRFGPTEDEDGKVVTNGLISPVELKALKTAARTMATAGKDDAAALTLVNVVQENFKIDEALAEPISATEEKINSLSYTIARKQKSVDAGEANQEEVEVLKQQLGMYENIRSAQLSRNNMYIIPDEEVQADLTARYFGLFKHARLKEGIKATLEDVFKFQQDMVKNRDKLDPTFFKKYLALSESAFQADIQNLAPSSDFQTKKKFWSDGLKPKNANQLSSSQKLRDVFTQVIEEHDPAQGNKDLYETMQIFYADLGERLDFQNEEDLAAIPQAELGRMIQDARNKMQLRKIGLPTYLGEEDIVYRGGGSYRIKKFDKDGMPLLEVVE